MTLLVEPPFGQDAIHSEIQANEKIRVYFENGDRSGWLYQAQKAPFSIKDKINGVEQVHGNVAFYVGGTFAQRYSFLDSVLQSPSLHMKQFYSCEKARTGHIFQNTLILDGTPDDRPAPVSPNYPYIECKNSLETSRMETKYKYAANCTNGQEMKISQISTSCCTIDWWRSCNEQHEDWDVEEYPGKFHIATPCYLELDAPYFDKLITRHSLCTTLRKKIYT